NQQATQRLMDRLRLSGGWGNVTGTHSTPQGRTTARAARSPLVLRPDGFHETTKCFGRLPVERPPNPLDLSVTVPPPPCPHRRPGPPGLEAPAASRPLPVARPSARPAPKG